MIRRYAQLGLLLSAAMALPFGACKKNDENKEGAPVTSPTTAPSTEAVLVPEEKPATPIQAAELSDYFYLEIAHAETKQGDPVKVSFPGMSVTSASFDSKNLEGGTAQIEIDLSTIDSGVPKRDGHLATPDYLDIAKHPKAVITIKDVKKKDASTYMATADVSVHGVDRTWPVEFQVIETTPTTIIIQAEHSFSRLDFDIGKAKDDPAAVDVLAKLRVTLANT